MPLEIADLSDCGSDAGLTDRLASGTLATEHHAVVIAGSLVVRERGQAGALHGVVRLEDVSLADAPSRILATTSISVAADVSQNSFRLMINSAPDSKHSYLIGAVLEGEEKTTGRRRVFGTTVAHPWTPGSTDDLVVEVRPWE